ncbi:hypothetical protein ACGF0J_00325 [Nonomuraea sp. NPDC047897]|uniref:hypothetical protein n=1 Tax=Nonomuraea sp. NPDC047897 TaxID=3364346 RepID=UPI003710EDB0
MAFPDDREDDTESAPRRFLRKKRGDDTGGAAPRSRKGRKEAADTGDTFGMTDPFGEGPPGSFGGPAAPGPFGAGGGDTDFFGAPSPRDPFDTTASRSGPAGAHGPGGPGGPGSGSAGPGRGAGGPGTGGPGAGRPGAAGPGGPGPTRHESFAPGGPQRDPFDGGAPGSGPAPRGFFDAAGPGSGPGPRDPFGAGPSGPDAGPGAGPDPRNPFGTGAAFDTGAPGADPRGPGTQGPGTRGSDSGGRGTRGRDPFDADAPGSSSTDSGTRGRDPFDTAAPGPSRPGSRRRAPFGSGSDKPGTPGAEETVSPGTGAADGKKAADTARNTQRRETWSPYAEGPRSRGPLWFVLGGVAVLGLLVGGLVLMFRAGEDDTTAAQTTRRTSAPLPSGPPGKYAYAGSRKTDPEPLTVKELFPAKKLTVSGRSYQMTITSKLKKCADGAMGAKMQKALKDGKCTQLIRASFRDKAGKVIGTVGVANLSTSKAATKVASVGSETNYVKPLPGKDEVTKLVGSGSGGANVWMHGHYAVMIWFQNKDGSKPDKKSQKAITGAVKDITGATVFKALDARSMTGFPAS